MVKGWKNVYFLARFKLPDLKLFKCVFMDWGKMVKWVGIQFSILSQHKSDGRIEEMLRYILLESVTNLALHPLLQLAVPDHSGQHSLYLECVFSRKQAVRRKETRTQSMRILTAR